jgi:uncharacterized heparinase superfamily protein
MRSSRWLGLARKALQRPPRYVAARIWQEALRQARRPWGHVRPRLLTDRALLALAGSPSIDALWRTQAASPFFLRATDRESWAASFRARFPDAVETIIDEATRRARHEFDLLGSGPVTLGSPLPWHTDFKTGRTWPLSYAPDIDYNELDQPSDVKVPWELSRCQHFVRFGQAYWLTGDERHAEAFVAQASDWIRENPWTRGVNWACTMDVALRAVSWVWAFHFLAGSRACSDPGFQATLLRSLYLHGEFIANNLELSDVNGNHYLSDGVGLVVLGVFFGQTAAGARWRQAGQAIVVGEMATQVWADGVDFEQSTAYHRLVLEAFQTSYLLLRRAGHSVPDAAWQRLARMYEFVAAYTKPDGRAPLIGDADDGRIQILGTQTLGDHRYLCSTGAAVFDRDDLKGASGRCWDETFWLLGPDGVARFDALPSRSVESRAFQDSGFYVMRGGDAHVIVDCGDNGMRGRGGHGHNDVLGFELFLGGMNIFTDCGAYLYTASRQWRNAFRSTAFHNVLEVDGEELNRFVHPDDLWRLHYDAVPADVSWHPGAERAVVAASHTGYSRLREPVRHRRELGLDWRQSHFVLRDTLTGVGRHTLVWRFHLEPGLTATEVGGDWQLSGERGSVWLLPVSLPDGARASVEAGWVSESYGRRRPNHVLTVRAEALVPTAFACLVAPDRLGGAARRDALILLEHAE